MGSTACKCMTSLVGPPGFEPGTSCTPNRCRLVFEAASFEIFLTQGVVRLLLNVIELCGARMLSRLHSYLQLEYFSRAFRAGSSDRCEQTFKQCRCGDA